MLEGESWARYGISLQCYFSRYRATLVAYLLCILMIVDRIVFTGEEKLFPICYSFTSRIWFSH